MKKFIIGTFVAGLLAAAGHAAEPLRVFIRSGEKTHGPGAHDHPAFLADWTKLLNERGAKASGGGSFPTKEQLAETDVIVIHAEEGGNITGGDRANFEEYLKRGGGVVAVHGGTVSRDPDWYKTVIGGSWRFGKTKWLEGHMSLYFTDRENPITTGMSNFDLDDEIYYDMELLPEVKVLAGAFTPKPKDASHPGDDKRVNIYDIQPQMWTYETGNRRALAFVPGHLYENFSHASIRTLLLRGIAWAGKRENADEFCRADELGDVLRYPEGGPTRPEKAAAKIELHPEFDISLVAAEPLINKVMNVDWDEKGRMWVVETPEYPNGLRKANTEEWKESGSVAPGKYDREPQDRISILTDTDGDGVMDKKHVFADKLELATGFVLHKNGVIVSAAPDIWFLEDTNGDEIADKRTKLYTGLGIADTHAVLNNLRWGLDGWIYGTHGYSAGDVTALGEGGKGKAPVKIGSGVVRFKADGSEIEMYSSKGGNSWGLCMTTDGQCFWTQPTSGIVFLHTVLPEAVLAKGKIPGTDSWNGMVVRQKLFPLMKWEQLAYVQIDLVGSYTAAAGCAVYEGGAWPDKWNYSYFTGEPTVNLVSHYFVKPDGVTYTAEREKGREETEFIRSSDLWFRPIENRVGPDGALYLVDFYNQAVIHNDTRGPLHGPANAAVRPDRDHYFGRIWKIQHKNAKKLEVPVINRNKAADIIKASASPNSQTRLTAMRLLREGNLVKDTEPVGSGPNRTYEKFASSTTPQDRRQVLKAYGEAKDNWTRSALIAAASAHAVDYLNEVLASGAGSAPLESFVANLLPEALRENPAVGARDLVLGVAGAPKAPVGLKAAVLTALASRQDIRPEVSNELATALGKLMDDNSTLPMVLPLIVNWDQKGALADRTKTAVASLEAKLKDAKAPEAVRISAASALVGVGSKESLGAVVNVLKNTGDVENVQKAALTALAETNHIEEVVPILDHLRPSLVNEAFDGILKRSEASLALLDAVGAGSIKPETFGPGNIARLRTHPDKKVADRAKKMEDKLNPGGKAKAEVIAKLLPEVSKPGNVENGKMLYAAACAICHRFGDVGDKDVGPPLTGMGSHGAAELLVHIVDPNREVDPSFWQWNITTKKGESLAGVITSENSAAITLRNQGGDVEIRKDDIATRENTHRSLMPEGLEGLGGEGLRDILSYMTASEGRYRVLDLREAYTADSRMGLFANQDARGDSVFFSAFGNIAAEKIPFFLMDPEKSVNGRNLLILKGGVRENIASKYPLKVDVPVDLEATRFYLLSGIAGWGFPAIKDFRPAMKVGVHFEDGRVEETVLLNGMAFGDYNKETDISGSKLVKKVVDKGQIRMIRIDVKKPGKIKKLTLESSNNGVTPVVAAITADLSSEAAEVETKTEPKELEKYDPKTTAPTGAKFQEPKVEGTLRVLLAGAGSSHDFPRYFLKEDTEILKAAGGIDVAATPNLGEALALIPQADVLVFSGNDPQYARPDFQKAINAFADAGKGLVMLHAATWYNYPPETGYNARFIGGGTRSHGKGDFDVLVINKDHPVTKGVAPKFVINDESYRMEVPDASKVEILTENHAEGAVHPSVWVTKDAKTRIVGITLGHAAEAHGNPDFQKLLVNAVRWVASK
jgi:putative membrane-bound dehydrogenase-like protein